jgi:hypothetical protein
VTGADELLVAEDAKAGLRPLGDPGVVTVAGDWHGDAEFADLVVRNAPVGAHGLRTVVQLGDFGVWPGGSGTEFLDAVAASLRRLNAILLFVDGNHEDHPQLLSYPLRPDGLRVVRPRLYHLPRAFRWRWHGARWLALGGAHSIDRGKRTEGIDWWPQEAVTPAQASAAAVGGRADYLITHDCPAGVQMPGIKDPEPGQPQELYEELVTEAGFRDQLRDVVETVRPRRLLHGHYHVRHDAQLKLANGAGCAITGLGKTTDLAENAIVLDLLRDEFISW